jgi:uncharacterized membrane protein
VVAEAVGPDGGQYSDYARVSKLTGKPAVLGWVGHESQWRGGGEEMGSRKPDLERLYCTRSWDEARQVLEQYDIRYIFLGNLERLAYQPSQSCPTGLVQSKFERYLTPVYDQGEVVIYEYSPAYD